MKRLVPLSIAMAVFITTLAVGSPGNANGQSAGLVSSVLNRMEGNRQSLKSLRSGISMEKYNVQLGLAEKYYGVVLYVPGGGRNAAGRIDWSSPQHEILGVSNGQYTLFRPRLGVAYKGSARSKQAKVGNILNMRDMSRSEL